MSAKKIQSLNIETELGSIYKILRGDMKKKWKRVLPNNELLSNRWEKAEFIKAKKGASIYDNSYIFGNVKIGRNTWVGPFTILDGSGGGILVGDNCSISSGVHIYTHNTVKWALTGGKAEYEKKSVKIGNYCYIGPYSIITMGSSIGKCCVIGAHSLVNSKIPPYSIVMGIPGKVVGNIKIHGKKVTFNYFKTNMRKKK